MYVHTMYVVAKLSVVKKYVCTKDMSREALLKFLFFAKPTTWRRHHTQAIQAPFVNNMYIILYCM